MTTYSLKINEIKVIPSNNEFNDIVSDIYWVYTGVEEDGRAASFGGITTLPFNTNTENFIPYNDLNEDIVKQWLLDSWTPEQLQLYETTINEQITKIAKKLPWAAPDPMPDSVDDISNYPPPDIPEVPQHTDIDI